MYNLFLVPRPDWQQRLAGMALEGLGGKKSGINYWWLG